MKTFEKFASGVGILTGLFAIGYSYFQGCKTHEIANKLDMSIDELGRKTKLDISEAMVNAAVDKIANREVGHMVRTKAESIAKDISDRLTDDIHESVRSSYEKAKYDIETKLIEECSKAIDPDTLKLDISKKVNEKIVAEAWRRLGLDNLFNLNGAASSSSLNGTDLGNLSAILDKVPTYERAQVISSIFGER